MGMTGINWDSQRHVRLLGNIRPALTPEVHVPVDDPKVGTGPVRRAGGVVTAAGTQAVHAAVRPVVPPIAFKSGSLGDIVGFGDEGVWVALANGDGTFAIPHLAISNFAYDQGWRVDQHPRLLADLTGDKCADVIGFGDAGVWVALSNRDGTFQAPRLVLNNFAVQQGWQVDKHPRFVADITGDGRADLVGFGDAGVWVALSNGDGTFQTPRFVLNNFAVQQGWQVDKHPRFVADITGDGRADLVGFGDAGVWTALSNGDGTFQAPRLAVNNFAVQQGWQVDKHPRFVTDITGDGRADLVGFGDAGVWTAVSNGDGTFHSPAATVADFGASSGSGGVRHVFGLLLENRAFDHMLGFSAITGIDAVTGRPTTIEGLTGNEGNDFGGQHFPVTRGADNVMPADPGHEFEDVVVQLAGSGATYPPGGPYPPITNSGFATIYESPGRDTAEIMKCFTPDQLPILTQLAREFVVCDHWFSSLPGPTFPNRFFAHAASSGGLDHSPSNYENTKWELVDGFDFPKGSIYDALDRAGLSYSLYSCDDLPVVASLSGISVTDVNDFNEDLAGDLSSSDGTSFRYVHIEPSYDIFNSYRDGNSQHPLGDVQQGELFLKQAYETIRNSPLWDDSLLIITWDEHGGFFDHVAPPAAVPPNDGPPEDDDLNQHGFRFEQLGVRVPAIIVSPRVPKNLVDHRVYDHASIPAAIERILGIPPLTDRDQAVNSPHTLLTLWGPRTDAPTTLDGALASPRAAGTVLQMPPAKATEPVTDPSVKAFLVNAVIHDLKMSDPAQHPAIIANAKTLVTYGQAFTYAQSVATRARSLRREHRASVASRGPVLAAPPRIN